MAMLLVVATTEATDPTRDSYPFRTAANVASALSLRPLGAPVGLQRWCVHDKTQTASQQQTLMTKPMNPSGPYHQEKEVNNHGCKEEGREEAGCQEEGRQEEVTTSSIVS